MKPLLFCATLALFSSCSEPVERVQPFIFIALDNPDGFVAPVADVFHVTNRSIVDGNPIFKEFDVDGKDLSLPTSFAIQFSEGIRGNIVDIEVSGLIGGEVVWFSETSAIADVSEIEMIARFCGDGLLDEVLPEECDDGDLNSDIEPDACRTSCSAAFCGDAVLDAGEGCDDGASNSDTAIDACRTNCALPTCGDGATDTGEECDDGNNTDADGCEADCTLPTCGNGIVDPEDFLGDTCFIESTITSQTSFFTLDTNIADIDGDGNQDFILWGNVSPHQLRILFMDSQGNVQQVRNIDGSISSIISSGFGFILVDDLFPDQNHLLDIAVVNGDKKIAIYRNLGNRNFSASVTVDLPVGNSAFTISDVSSADFDNDGDRDLVVATRDHGFFIYSFNQATSSFGGGVAVPVGVSGDGVFSKTADLDGDLVPDLVLVEAVGNVTKINLGKGIGANSFIFTSIDLPDTTVFSFQPESIVVKDRNNDGQLDITIDAVEQKLVTIFTDNCAPNNNVTEQPTSSGIIFFRITDMDLDGEEDFVFKINTDIFLDISSTNAILTFQTGAQLDSFELSDFNKDGVVDIINFQFNNQTTNILLTSLNP